MYWRYLLLSLILVVVGQTGLARYVSSRFSGVLVPLQHSAYHFSIDLQRELSFWARLRDLRGENLRLTQKLAELEGQKAQMNECVHENQVIKKQLEATSSVEGKLLLVQIIGRSPTSGRAEIMINRGASEGVKTGSAVIYQDALVGIVVATEDNRSQVRLTIDPEFKAAAVDSSSPNRARGLVVGSFGTKLRFEKVLPQETINEGDMLVTSGEDGNLPKGLFLGKIKSVIGQEADVFRQAEVSVPIDVSNLDELFVIKL